MTEYSNFLRLSVEALPIHLDLGSGRTEKRKATKKGYHQNLHTS